MYYNELVFKMKVRKSGSEAAPLLLAQAPVR